MKPWEKDDTYLSRWLNDELSPNEKRSFESTEEGKQFKEIIKASQSLQKLPYDIEARLANLKEEIKGHRKTKTVILRPWIVTSIAASLTLLVVFYFVSTDSKTTYETIAGQQRSIWLPDSSLVLLNGNSAIAYHEKGWDQGRMLELTGEAYFDVKPGATFTVETSKGLVTVLGTRFSVKERMQRYEVICYEGQVKVNSAEVDTVLIKGASISLLDERPVAYSSITEEKPDWLKGITRLQNVSLTEALDELQNIYPITVMYDQELPEVTYTGSFPHDNVELAVKLILDPLNIEYRYDPQVKTLTIRL